LPHYGLLGFARNDEERAARLLQATWSLAMMARLPDNPPKNPRSGSKRQVCDYF
jgi:hypothetical protein